MRGAGMLPGERRRRERERALADFLGNSAPDEVVGGANGVAHGLRVRAPVPDETGPVHAEKRRAAVLAVVEAFLEGTEGVLRKQKAHRRLKAAGDLLFERLLHEVREALGDLEDDVSREAVRDDDVDVTAVNVAALDVPDETEAGLLQEAERFLHDIRALALLLAHGHEADLRLLDAKNFLREEVPHEGELAVVLGATIHVRPDVEENPFAVEARQHGGEGRPVDALDDAHD